MGTFILKTISNPTTPKAYTLKRFSNVPRKQVPTYVLKRKTFGFLGDTANGIGKGVNRTVSTVEETAGSVMTGTGKAMDSFAGKNVVGTTAGSIAGLALAPKIGAMLGGPLGGVIGGFLAPTVGLVGGGLLGRGIMGTGGKILKDTGEGLKDDAASRTA